MHDVVVIVIVIFVVVIVCGTVLSCPIPGMAGMAAARALSDHFDRVTIVERDAVNAGTGLNDNAHNAKATPRKGVPQSRQPHILLVKGLRAMASFYPGLDARLRLAGAVSVNYSADLRMFNHGEWYCRVPRDEELQGWSCSRPMLEKKGRVEGVHLKDAGAEETANGEDVSVDMLVDAGGRRSQVPKWLEEHGYDKPEEKVINSYIGYSTRLYDVPPDFGKDWKIMMELPWALSTGEDLRYPMTTGGSGVPLSMRLMNKYFLALMDKCKHEPEYTRVLNRMMHMIDPPTAIFRPDIAMGVLKHMIVGSSKAKSPKTEQQQQQQQPSATA
eukprot:jgi/Chlat1/7261/Chrsp58S06873